MNKLNLEAFIMIQQGTIDNYKQMAIKDGKYDYAEEISQHQDIIDALTNQLNTLHDGLNVVDKIKYIQEKLPKKYELLVRTNKGENTFNPDGGDWFVHLSKETGSYLQNHDCSTKSLYKEYGNDIDLLLNNAIEIVDKIELE